FHWKDEMFGKFPLELERPPELSEVTRLVRLVGERSKDANRVEVPFEYVAPRQIEVWTADSRNGLSVAIGRAGATKRHVVQPGPAGARGREGRFRLVRAPARSDHEPGPQLLPGRGRAVPDRLQERSGVQALRPEPAAARAGRRDRKRARIRAQCPAAARRHPQ